MYILLNMLVKHYGIETPAKIKHLPLSKKKGETESPFLKFTLGYSTLKIRSFQ